MDSDRPYTTQVRIELVTTIEVYLNVIVGSLYCCLAWKVIVMYSFDLDKAIE